MRILYNKAQKAQTETDMEDHDTMKKLMTISLALAMLLMAAGCGGNNTNPPSSGAESGYEDSMLPSDETSDIDDMTSTEQPGGDEITDNEVEKPSDSKPAEKPAEKPSDSKPAAKPTEKPAEKPAAKPNDSKPAQNTYSGSLSGLIDAIYATTPVDLFLGDSTAVDLSDSYQAEYYLGLSDASKVKEAYVSEPMMGSQAYSLVVVRVKDAADTASVAQSMYDGINQSKWICVTADSLAVGAYGDTIMLAMVDSEFGKTLHTDLRSAYAKAVGGKLDVSLDRVDTEA